MSSASDQVKKSKLLSMVLRHQPEAIGIQLDANGWVEVDVLLNALRSHRQGMSRDQLDEIVATNNKKRFAFSPDGTRIRASQGHSVEVDLALAPQVPPAVLYHGTVAKFLPAILAEGLQKMERRHVHLSPDVKTAQKVGERRGKPVILEIDAAKMQADGHVFYQSENGVWLVDAVPPQYFKQMP